MKRQFCASCLRTTSEYRTDFLPDGRRFHYCLDERDCALARQLAEEALFGTWRSSGAGRREPGEDFALAVESEDDWI